MDDSEPSALARRLGELEGSAFDAHLAALERAERGERLSRIALTTDAADLLPADAASAPRRDHAETESRLRDLSQFHQAVMNSRGWKLLQRVRWLFGRAW